ncbi:uncharacterized protein LOC131050709 isoform X2 [Cryptomeria japonica]|uniref:uncharacterized protein LOC131050709 isoform X2 n=1 Tax=Cryptomeria japonica TaxID=3369 RepID=UPI0027DA72F8|nr:uncharacterized protein LOC131050709 isoform X2 [Cryptomeria japonica]
MIPDGSIIVESTVSSKGLSWVDRMYQKFEHICEEVDKNPSHLIQETTKYVENQVSIAGANVRKICAEVIQEILPPAPEAAIKSLSSIITVDLEEKFIISEKPKPDPEKTNSLITKSVDLYKSKQDFANVKKEPDVVFASCETLHKSIQCNPQDADSDLSILNTSRLTPPPHLQETLDAEKQSATLTLEPDNRTDDVYNVHKLLSLPFADPIKEQQSKSIQLDGSIRADEMGKTPLDVFEDLPEINDGLTVRAAIEPFCVDHFQSCKFNSTVVFL